MKIDFNYKFKELDGKIIPEQPDGVEEKDGKVVKKKFPPFTLRTASVNALSGASLEQINCPRCDSTLRLPEQISGEKKCERFELARKIHSSNGIVDLGVDDIKLLKELIAKALPSNLIVGQAWEILDPHKKEG